MKTFQGLQKKMGLDMAMEAFWEVLSLVEMDLFHDSMSCPNCCVQGDWEYCSHSCFHPQHDLHVCLETQVCFCLNPKYSYDHFN